MKRYVLVACSKSKLAAPAKARDLYTGTLFKAAREVAEKSGDLWFILSALHGLVTPGCCLDPYNRTLADLDARGREEWARRIVRTLRSHSLTAGDEVVFLAGRKYREPLAEMLRAEGCRVEIPLAGLGIGQQIARLKSWQDGERSTL